MSHMTIDTAVPLWLTLTVIIASAISLLSLIALFAKFLSFTVDNFFDNHRIYATTLSYVVGFPLVIAAMAFMSIDSYAEGTFDKNAETINAHTGDSNTMVIDDTNGQSQIHIPANKDTTTACIAYSDSMSRPSNAITMLTTNTFHTELQCAPIDSNLILSHRGH